MRPQLRGPLGVPVNRRVLGVLAAGLALAVTLVAAFDGEGQLSLADAVVLGVVEGVTEYLPVSSTGHLAVVQRLIGVASGQSDADAAADAYAIAIQFGAILAVLGLYRQRIAAMARGLAGADREGRRVALAVILAFLPFAALGYLFGDAVKEHLFGIWPVVFAWAVGGVVILVLAPRLPGGPRALEAITVRDAALIGAAQLFALVPGTSRSLTTILAALAVGLSIRAAVEFSFLLGLLTLGVATVYEALRQGTVIIDHFGLVTPLVGVGASFVAAVVAVRWLVEYLSRRPLTIFGWYRIGIAAVVGGLALAGVV